MMSLQYRRRVLLILGIVGGLSTGALGPGTDGQAQTTAPQVGPTEQPTAPQVGPTEGGAITGPGPTTQSTTPRTDLALEERRIREDERARERKRHVGETYVAGFGGVTFGGTTSNMEARGSSFGQSIQSPNLEDSAVYGMKVGYFHPGRLNWLGLEIEGYNANPHLKEAGLQPGSHLRLTTLGLNAIARTRLACRDKRDDRRDRGPRDESVDEHYSPLSENARCPVQLYAGAGLGVFFAETSNQFGRSTDNARAGLNALAGVKYFFNEHLALFAEYKFNYVDLKFDQNQFPNGSTSGMSGTYMINHVVGGLAWHF